MSYPQDFVDEVREEFGDREDILELVEDGRHILGSILAKEGQACLDPREVVRAFDRGEPEKVLEAARRTIRRRNLHKRWLQIMLESVSVSEPEDVRFQGEIRAQGT